MTSKRIPRRIGVAVLSIPCAWLGGKLRGQAPMAAA